LGTLGDPAGLIAGPTIYNEAPRFTPRRFLLDRAISIIVTKQEYCRTPRVDVLLLRAGQRTGGEKTDREAFGCQSSR
jgi:hypothetical protein